MLTSPTFLPFFNADSCATNVEDLLGHYVIKLHDLFKDVGIIQVAVQVRRITRCCDGNSCTELLRHILKMLISINYKNTIAMCNTELQSVNKLEFNSTFPRRVLITPCSYNNLSRVLNDLNICFAF